MQHHDAVRTICPLAVRNIHDSFVEFNNRLVFKLDKEAFSFKFDLFDQGTGTVIAKAVMDFPCPQGQYSSSKSRIRIEIENNSALCIYMRENMRVAKDFTSTS